MSIIGFKIQSAHEGFSNTLVYNPGTDLPTRSQRDKLRRSEPLETIVF